MALTSEQVDRLLAELSAIVLRSGKSAAYVGIGRAPEIVRWLADHGYRLLGMEGFSSDCVEIRPVVGYIIDLSDVEGIDATAKAAIAVLDLWRSSVEWLDLSIEKGT